MHLTTDALWARARRLRLPADHWIWARLRMLKGYESRGIDVSRLLMPLHMCLLRIEIPSEPSGPWAQPDPTAIVGDYRIGRTFNVDCPSAFGLSRESLEGGTFASGGVGAGKTTFAIALARGVFDEGQMQILFIDAKGDYAFLAREYPDIDVYTERNFRTSIFEPPPGIPTRLWYPRAVDVACSSLGLMEGSASTLSNAVRFVDELCRQAAPDGEIWYPTLAHLRDLFADGGAKRFNYSLPSGRQGGDYATRLRTRLENLCEVWPASANMSSGIHIDGTRSAVLDVSAIGKPGTSAMLAEFVIMRIYTQRLLEQYRPGRIDLLVIMDEAQMLVGDQKAWHEPSPFPPMVQLLTRCREFGMQFVIMAQSPSEIRQTVRANAANRIVFPLNDGEDIRLMARSMNLDHDQLYDLKSLRRGEAIVQLQGLDPFPVRVDYSPVDKSFSAEDVEAHMARRLAEQTVVEAPSLDEIYQKAKKAQAAAEVAARGVELSSEEEEMLRLVFAKQQEHLGKADLARQSPFEYQAATRLLDELERKRMIHHVHRKASPKARQGRRRRMYYLDNDGAKYLGLDRTAHPLGRVGRGGWLHCTLMHEGAKWWRELGYTVSIEAGTGRKNETVDLVIEDPKGDQRVAVEIECSSGQALSNIRKCLEVGGFTEVWVVPKNPGVRAIIERELMADTELQKAAKGTVDLLPDSTEMFRREAL